jgi:hypothetical protein
MKKRMAEGENASVPAGKDWVRWRALFALIIE